MTTHCQYRRLHQVVSATVSATVAAALTTAVTTRQEKRYCLGRNRPPPWRREFFRPTRLFVPCVDRHSHSHSQYNQYNQYNNNYNHNRRQRVPPRIEIEDVAKCWGCYKKYTIIMLPIITIVVATTATMGILILTSHRQPCAMLLLAQTPLPTPPPLPRRPRPILPPILPPTILPKQQERDPWFKNPNPSPPPSIIVIIIIIIAILIPIPILILIATTNTTHHHAPSIRKCEWDETNAPCALRKKRKKWGYR